jgi:hypothetical protein
MLLLNGPAKPAGFGAQPWCSDFFIVETAWTERLND